MSEGSHSTYTIVLRWREQEQVYRAEVPALPGCEGSGHGYEAALASVQDAIRWWHERSGEGSASPFSQMLMEEDPKHQRGNSAGRKPCLPAQPAPKRCKGHTLSFASYRRAGPGGRDSIPTSASGRPLAGSQFTCRGDKPEAHWANAVSRRLVILPSTPICARQAVLSIVATEPHWDSTSSSCGPCQLCYSESVGSRWVSRSRWGEL